MVDFRGRWHGRLIKRVLPAHLIRPLHLVRQHNEPEAQVAIRQKKIIVPKACSARSQRDSHRPLTGLPYSTGVYETVKRVPAEPARVSTPCRGATVKALADSDEKYACRGAHTAHPRTRHKYKCLQRYSQ